MKKIEIMSSFDEIISITTKKIIDEYNEIMNIL